MAVDPDPDGWARLLAMVAKNTAERPERHKEPPRTPKPPKPKKPKQGVLPL